VDAIPPDGYVDFQPIDPPEEENNKLGDYEY
jgi:hypothetical protein